MWSSTATPIALLDTLNGPKLLTIGVVALIVLGPERLPGVARQAGLLISKARAVTSSVRDELNEVLDDPAMAPFRELGSFATQPRRKLADYAAQFINEPDREAASLQNSPSREPPAEQAPN